MYGKHECRETMRLHQLTYVINLIKVCLNQNRFKDTQSVYNKGLVAD